MASRSSVSTYASVTVTILLEDRFFIASNQYQISPTTSHAMRTELQSLAARDITPTMITVAVQTSLTTIHGSAYSSDDQSQSISRSQPLLSNASASSRPSDSEMVDSSSQLQTSAMLTGPPVSSGGGFSSPSSRSYSYEVPGIVVSPLPSTPSTIPMSSPAVNHSASCKIAIAILSTAVGMGIIAVLALMYYTPKRWKARGAKTRDEELAKIQKESGDWKVRYELLRDDRIGVGMTPAEGGSRPSPGMGMGFGMGDSVPMVPLRTGPGPWY